MFNQNPMYQPLTGLFRATAKSGFNWSGLLTNTQKTLSIVNQAIPIFYQVKPIWNNAKTMFRVMGELGKINDTPAQTNVPITDTTVATKQNIDVVTNPNINQPNFFI